VPQNKQKPAVINFSFSSSGRPERIKVDFCVTYPKHGGIGVVDVRAPTSRRGISGKLHASAVLPRGRLFGPVSGTGRSTWPVKKIA
jgi:hypothetical protein